ncbi:MinD/ParA family protein [Mucisphaera sp.]|uniref:MinD/ParA family protein n=1 Tax=Mucisphaera sp. TaxID=2913024 RepID=UPI003D12E44B
MLTDQAEALRQMVSLAGEPTPQPGLTRAIAIASGKGGVGKTTLSVNLAVALSRLGRRVVLLDADLGTANADVLCQVPPGPTLAHVVAGRCELADVLVEAPGGFQLIPGASGLASMANLGEAQRQRMIAQLQAIESEADLLLIDLGAGVSPNVLSFAIASDQVLVVTTPEPTAITDAYALVKTLHRESHDPALRLVVNMVRSQAEAEKVYGRISEVSRKFVGVAPSFAGHLLYDPKVALSVMRRTPFTLERPQSGPSICVDQLAHRLDRFGATLPEQGFFSRFSRWWAST